VSAIAFTAAHFAVALFGLPAAFHPSLREAHPAVRAAAASAAGAVALTLEATLLSILRVPWSVASLSLPLLGFSLALTIRWSRRPFLQGRRSPASGALGLAAAVAGGLALLHLVFSLATARATSADFLFFWGVKGARFAAVRGIDSNLLGDFFSHHMVPDYPPLVPILYSWGTLVAGELPWQFAPVLSAFWVLAATPLLVFFLRRTLPSDAAVALTAFWTVALAISAARSFSGGNAEAPLLFFETVALAALLAERPDETGRSRFFPALALSGAALTKVEGTVAVLLIVAGVALRDLLERRPRVVRRLVPLAAAPLACTAVWFAFQATHGLPVGFRTHGGLSDLHFDYVQSVVKEFARHLSAGTAGLSWVIPVVLLVASARRIRANLLPALSLATGLLLFFLFDYLQDPTDPAIRIGWTLPRISQPALSALILAAGLAGAARIRSLDGDEPGVSMVAAGGAPPTT